jgi:transposase InsO family protein
MKLTRGKLMETIRKKNQGWTTYQARKIAWVSIRRVNQIYTGYLKSGKIPELGRKTGRPAKPILEKEIELVEKTYFKYRVSASTLEKIIERDFKVHIGHNHIHRIMIKLGLAKPKSKKDVRKKDWIRYERRHSLTAVHIDWYYCSETEIWVFGVIDDASRKLLSLTETKSPTTDASIEGMIEAQKQGRILQCISDHGSQFTDNKDGKSRFVKFLKKHKIKQILCRIKHPQSNGKIEKWFQAYRDHRQAFKTKEDFMFWYNELRPHRSLNFEALETPQHAFIRKMKAEA